MSDAQGRLRYALPREAVFSFLHKAAAGRTPRCQVCQRTEWGVYAFEYEGQQLVPPDEWPASDADAPARQVLPAAIDTRMRYTFVCAGCGYLLSFDAQWVLREARGAPASCR